ncbi:hypothetical protein AVEN_140940-1 [Araneus ventricosus]|uniref:Uncharacterized protein n=1 Tax=Araneus ventricosus TaxID=182803 RepID=A0A4Y2GDQ6_ARAVE|nr:hypothetical protein AVEN_140940-1 [Araneus ventricosus]
MLTSSMSQFGGGAGYDKYDGRARQKSTTSRTSSREFGLLLDSTRGQRQTPDSKETAPKLPADTSSAPISVAPVPILTYQSLYFLRRRPTRR